MKKEIENREVKARVYSACEFYYDPKTRIFSIGEEGQMLNFDLETTKDVNTLAFVSLESGKELDDFEGHVMGISYDGSLIEYPLMRSWIANLDDVSEREVKQIVADEMENVWQILNPDIKFAKRTKNELQWYYRTSLFPDGTFIVNTIGNCACFGRDPHSMSVFAPGGSIENINNPVGNTFHNADVANQRLSLYAGAGTLAWLARQSISFKS